MIRIIVKLTILNILCLVYVISAIAFQTDENTEFKIVHNTKSLWGETPNISLEFMFELGGEDIDDENYDFYRTSDIEIDEDGNIYALSRNYINIRKYDKSGKFLQSFGSEGQGPSEFLSPMYLALDSDGNMYVDDWKVRKILVLDQKGKEIRRITLQKLAFTNPGFNIVEQFSNSNYAGSGQQIILLNSGNFVKFNNFPMPRPKLDSPPLRPLCRIFDKNGKLIKEFGNPRQYNDWLMNFTLNYFSTSMTHDEADNIYINYNRQNRIEKYDSEGNILLRIDRPLERKETTERVVTIRPNLFAGERYDAEWLKFNVLSGGIAVDDKGRIWVVTRTPQKVENRNESKFDVFNKEGIFLGSLKLESPHIFTTLSNATFSIHKDKLFVMGDSYTLLVYKILSND